MDLLHTRRGNVLLVAAIAAVFLALRVALLLARDPFFDELFTSWIVNRPFGAILEALRHDSGPPLYYFTVHTLGLRSVMAIRILSLCASLAALLVVATARSFGPARFMAAALLAVYPAAVLFAADARAYALAAVCVAIGLILMWNGRLFAAAIVFAIAGYTHYYGALFLPFLTLPLPLNVQEVTRFPVMRRAAAFSLGALLLLPVVALAFVQPRESMGWLDEPAWSFARSIAFAGRYPYGLFASAPMTIVFIASIALVVCVVAPLVTRRANRLYVFAAAATLVPLVLAIAAGVYFPLRFDSLIAVPLTLWIAVSCEAVSPLFRRSFATFFLVVGLATTWAGIVDHTRRPVDPYRDAATWAARHVPARERLVASGYCYLEAVSAMPGRVVAFPAAQGLHPGWRALPERTDVPPQKPFVWIGERNAPELQMLRRSSPIQPLYANGNALVAVVR